MSSDEPERAGWRLSIVVTLRSLEDGGLDALLQPARDEERLSVDPSVLVVSLWRESGDIVRGSIKHPVSGITAHFQGAKRLEDLSNELHLQLTRVGSAKDD